MISTQTISLKIERPKPYFEFEFRENSEDKPIINLYERADNRLSEKDERNKGYV